MEFDIKDAVLALVDAGVYDIYQKNVLQEQISYVEDAVYNRSRVIPYSSNIEMIIFVKQCCDYLLETDRFTFKQAFKDWNVSGMMTKQCFYTSVWNTEVLIQTDDSEPVYCTRKKIYEICSRSEYLDMDNHAQPIEIITHAATDRQVSMFILVMKSLSDGTTNYENVFDRIPECAYLTNLDAEQSKIVLCAKDAAKCGKSEFVIRSDNDASETVTEQLGIITYRSGPHLVGKFEDAGYDDYQELDEKMLGHLINNLKADKNFGRVLSCISNRIAELQKEKILRELIEDVSEKIGIVNRTGSSVRIDKIIGYGRFYEEIFKDLRSKNYLVREYIDYYKVGVGYET
ncbi:hypothetical protein AALB53_13965 [Lachnospiraceae bacterium 47-T17]